MSGSSLRSNNPFAQDAEQELQAHISDPNGLSRQSSINRSRPDPSILEDSSTDNITIDGDGNGNSTSAAPSSTYSTSNIPTIQIDQQPDSTQADSNNNNNLIDGNSRRSSISSNNGAAHEWDQVDDSHPDVPPPAYSEVDPLSTPGSPNLQAQSTGDNNNNNNIYQRPPGAPPSPSNIYQRPSVPPPLSPRPSQLNTQFQPPTGPPPPHLSPSQYSPNLPPRPTSPRLPARPNARRNQYPGASGATYSNIGAPPLPQRRN